MKLAGSWSGIPPIRSAWSKEQPRGILSDRIVGMCKQLFDDLMIRIDFKCGLQRGKVFLAHGTQYLLHLQGRFLFVRDDARGTVRQPHRSANIFDAVSECSLQLVWQRLQVFGIVT
jgi:hypothetical protein